MEGPVGGTGHTDKNGGSMSSRIEDQGNWGRTIGENLSYSGNTSGRSHVIQLLVDEGVPSLGHRYNIFKADFKTAGVGFGVHKNYGLMTCTDFAGSYTLTNP
jgi:uncharacterized protein YkwD